jgi:hypothetical protein
MALERRNGCADKEGPLAEYGGFGQTIAKLGD